jgi:OPA family sugar phosphate sensor protein UhpC-like MFS transporter
MQWLRPAERGRIMGVWSTNYLVGSIVVKSLGGFLLGAYGWRWSFWGCTLLGFTVWWIIFIWQRPQPRDVGLEAIVGEQPTGTHAVQASQADHVSFKQYTQLATNPLVLAMGASYYCIKFLRLVSSLRPRLLAACVPEHSRIGCRPCQLLLIGV